MSDSGWKGLRLDPLDVLFFRDGRPFDATNRVEGGLPKPQTFAGAMRTAMLARTDFDFQQFSNELKDGASLKEALASAPKSITRACFRGPWVGLVTAEEKIEPLLALPMNLAKRKNPNPGQTKFLRSLPLKKSDLPGWTGELRPLWRRGMPDSKAKRGLVTLSGLKQYLRGNDVEQEEMVSISDLYDFDNRTGIGIDPQTLASEEGQIYGARMLALKDHIKKKKHNENGEETGIKGHSEKKKRTRDGAKICLYAEVKFGTEDSSPEIPDALPFGGEGRYVHLQEVEACQWPAPASDQKPALWYLASPAIVEDPTQQQWPQRLNGKLQAAASTYPIAVSGWDVARNGPRPTRFAVPAGAVYFVDGQLELPSHSLCERADLAQEGWGFALQGIWKE